MNAATLDPTKVTLEKFHPDKENEVITCTVTEWTMLIGKAILISAPAVVASAYASKLVLGSVVLLSLSSFWVAGAALAVGGLALFYFAPQYTINFDRTAILKQMEKMNPNDLYGDKDGKKAVANWIADIRGDITALKEFLTHFNSDKYHQRFLGALAHMGQYARFAEVRTILEHPVVRDFIAESEKAKDRNAFRLVEKDGKPWIDIRSPDGTWFSGTWDERLNQDKALATLLDEMRNAALTVEKKQEIIKFAKEMKPATVV